jgi:hypothetical protein
LKQYIEEIENKHKREIEIMESQFENVLNNELKALKAELKQANQVRLRFQLFEIE